MEIGSDLLGHCAAVLLAMTTVAVHHRCITATPSGGASRTRLRRRKRIVEPKQTNR